MEYTCIEMNGLPGSGKTTLIENLNASILSKYWSQDEYYQQIKSRTGRIKTLLYCISKNFFQDVHLLFWILIHAEDGNKKAAIKRLFKILRFKGIHKRIKNDYLLSEGYVQAFLELLDYMPDDILDGNTLLKKYFKEDILNITNAFYIYLYYSPELSITRIKMRNSPNNTVDRTDDDSLNLYIRKRYRNSEIVNTYLVEILDESRILKIDANDSIEVNVEKMTLFLGRIAAASLTKSRKRKRRCFFNERKKL